MDELLSKLGLEQEEIQKLKDQFQDLGITFPLPLSLLQIMLQNSIIMSTAGLMDKEDESNFNDEDYEEQERYTKKGTSSYNTKV